MTDEVEGRGCAVIIVMAAISAWLTHVVWLIGKLASDAGATDGQIVLGLIAAFVPPIGAFHGFLLWIGAASW